MFTAEIRINGSLVATLHVHSVGTYDDINMCPYEYEYYEPEIGQKGRCARTPHVLGKVEYVRDKGIRHVIAEIFKDLDSKE